MGDRSRGGEDWVLSLDIGGTKTEALLVQPERREGINLTGKGGNPSVYGSHGLDRIVRLVRTCLEEGDLDPGDVKQCVAGMAGISHPRYGHILGKNLSALLSRARVTLISDAELAHRNLWGNEPGITLVAGTGSIAVGTDRKGRFRRAGGFGFQTGDEGGGYWLGKTILMELIAAGRSSSKEVQELTRTVLDHSGESDFEQLLTILSSGAEGVVQVARLGPVVLKSAIDGNNLASRTVAQGAEALARLVYEVSVKLDKHRGKVIVGASGSILQEWEFYRTRIQDELLLDFDQVDWVLPEYPPAFGGLVLAGVDMTPSDFKSLDIRHV